MTRWLEDGQDWPSVFNTPLECGLRAAVILLEAFPSKFDLQRLLQFDYLIVHSADVPDGPESLHPATPLRAGELLVRRPLIEQGVQMMMSRSVIECEFSTEGIRYFAGDWAVSFVGMLETEYVLRLRETASWVVERFHEVSDEDLNEFMRNHWSQWGAEFELESFVRASVQ